MFNEKVEKVLREDKIFNLQKFLRRT